MVRYSRFAVQKSKNSTARIAMWKELNVPYIYTLEASFLGPAASIVRLPSLISG